MDVESFSDGILGSIVTHEGDVAGVGNPIAYIAETDADLAEAKAKGSGGMFLVLILHCCWCISQLCIAALVPSIRCPFLVCNLHKYELVFFCPVELVEHVEYCVCVQNMIFWC